MEKWKAVKDYEGIYEVSNKGKVRTVEGKTTQSVRHGERVWKQRVLKSKIDGGGYMRVALYKNKKPKDFLVHRLVAIAFCRRRNDQNYVNHIDGNPSNNDANNLEWCTSMENVHHAFKNGLMKTNQPIRLIHNETKKEHSFLSKAEASRFLNRNPGYISAVLKRNENEADGYKIIEN